MHDEPTPSPSSPWYQRLTKRLHRKPHDRDDLIALLHHAKAKGVLNQDAMIMIEGVLKVSSIQVRDIMIPRGHMVVVEQSDTLQQILPAMIQSAHSRFPVVGESKDEIVGILLAKDLLQLLQQEDTSLSIQSLIRPAMFIPESKRIDVLLHEFRRNRYHMAIVVDEYAGVSGLVTIEDVLEQIVGSIEDETDDTVDQPNIHEQQTGVFLINALTPLDEFNAYFATQLDNEHADTIAGYLMQVIGHMPKRGESHQLGHYVLSVQKASRRRLEQLTLIDTRIHPE